MPGRGTTPNAQTALIERDLAILGQRFDRHLEIYSQNGKELAGLKVAVENLRNSIEKKTTTYESDQVILRNDFKDSAEKLIKLELDLAQLGTRIAVYATIGSAIASTAASIGIKVFF